MNILSLLSSDAHITVNKDLIKEVGLEEAVLFGEIVSEYVYWKNHNGLENGYYFSTIENMEEKTTLSGHKQRNALKRLQQFGIIDVKKMGIPAKRYITVNEEQVIKMLNLQSLKNLTTRNENIEEQHIQNINGNNNISNKNIENKNINNNIYKEIIDYLNEKASTNYKATTPNTQKFIKARLNEGFTADDFKKVIDKKCSDWIGTDYEMYLRPQTLFGNKFESYLNSKTNNRVGQNGIMLSEDRDDSLDDIF